MPPLDMGSGAVQEQAPAGPSAAPMSDPTEQEGLRAQAMQGVQMAIKVLESSLLALGTQSEEGKKILSHVNGLSKIAGPSGGPDLGQAELKLLAAKAGPQGAGGPASPAPPPGGGAPGGAPGGMKMGGPMPMGL